MPRPLRVEYAGARYHVLSRGDRKEAIVYNDEDSRRFLKTLGEAAIYAGWQVHAYCLMRNHFHLVIETPEPTLVKGMQWMLGTYTARFNARHKLRGHLFSGRYKAILVDDADDGYLRRVCDYTHLNPHRAKIVKPEEPLEAYAWSSYPLYLAKPKDRWTWLRVDALLGEHGIKRDSTRGRQEFSRRMEERRKEGDEDVQQVMKCGWKWGSGDFLERIHELIQKPLTENHGSIEKRETLEIRARRLIDDGLHEEKLEQNDLAKLPKGHPVKIKIAHRIHRETPMTLRWIAENLEMGTWRYVAFLLHREKKRFHNK